MGNVGSRPWPFFSIQMFNVYDGARQTSPSFFSQHHQLLAFNPRKTFILVNSLSFT
jgi:hypothetical protein